MSSVDEKNHRKNLLIWIDRKAAELASYGLHPSGRVDLTPSLLAAANIVKVDWFHERDTGVRGKIERQGTGYRVWVSGVLDEPGRRITIAHEIGHTLWFNQGTDAQPASARTKQPTNDELEFLCDYFAEALLMPEIQLGIGGSLLKDDRTLEIVDRIPEFAAKFQVPERYVVDRLALLFSNENFGYACATRVHHQETLDFRRRAAGDEWQLRWTYSPKIRKVSQIPKGLRMPGIGRRVTKPRIPAAMLPVWATDQAANGLLDGRWKYFIMPTSEDLKAFKMGFRAIRDEEPIEGVARLFCDRLYVCVRLPRESLQH